MLGDAFRERESSLCMVDIICSMRASDVSQCRNLFLIQLKIKGQLGKIIQSLTEYNVFLKDFWHLLLKIFAVVPHINLLSMERIFFDATDLLSNWDLP